AFKAENILYSLAPAESTPYEDRQFDLITVAQSLHWFDRPAFYREVNRVSKPGGLLAVWGYALLTVEPEIDGPFLDFYNNTVGPYWDEARKLVENEYRDISFPFDEIECPRFYIRVDWTFEQFAGYLSSWSATQKYIRTHQVNPVEAFSVKLRSLWKPGEVKRVTFPVFMKLGRV